MAFKNKAKGTRYENELYDLLIQAGYRCIRCAGSGTKNESYADLIAGKSGAGKYAIEAKSSKAPVKYITKEQIESFVVFSEIFGLIPVVALRFNREGWLFVNPSQLRDSGKNWAITLEEAKTIGKRFGQFFHSSNEQVDAIIEEQ
jgi:Holliday junction resolvase